MLKMPKQLKWIDTAYEVGSCELAGFISSKLEHCNLATEDKRGRGTSIPLESMLIYIFDAFTLRIRSSNRHICHV
jgi:hypothetical protein